MNWKCWLAAGIALTAPLAPAEVRLPALFSDHMVLQRERPCPVWGWADPGETVTVTVKMSKPDQADATVSTVADEAGQWRVTLPAMAAGGPLTLTVEGGNRLELSDVLVGEVWLCSGQSNMEWRTVASVDGNAEVAAADHPQIRLFKVPYKMSGTPFDDVESAWEVCSPETVGPFSAVGYFFGRDLQKELQVPVGLISSHWGGTGIDPWTSPEGFAMVDGNADILDLIAAKTPGSPRQRELLTRTLAEQAAWLEKNRKALADGMMPEPPPAYPEELKPFQQEGHPWQPTVLYNAMIRPLAPFALRGVLWYQGEANIRPDNAYYRGRMASLIGGWRKVFENADLPIYFVQLAPYNYGGSPYNLPDMWETQQEFADAEPRAHMVVINDVGNVNDIHPTDKQTVGFRLFKQAMQYEYGQKDAGYDFPRYDSHRIDGDRVIVSFRGAKSLRTADGKAPDWFEIAGKNGLFYPAEAVIDGTDIVLSAPEVNAPVMVRFAWSMLAEPNLRDEEGLPCGAFRAGSLPERGELDDLVPEAKQFELVYKLNPLDSVMVDGNRAIRYELDRHAALAGRQLKRVGYFVQLVDEAGTMRYLWVSLKPFTDDPAKIGVPTAASGAFFQTFVEDLQVASNVPGVPAGAIARGNIEFWPANYGMPNAAKVPGASNESYDFGDESSGSAPGYGSMQLHDYQAGKTLFAYNNWGAGIGCDIGIGSRPEGHPDWTFSGSGKTLKLASILVLAELEPAE